MQMLVGALFAAGMFLGCAQAYCDEKSDVYAYECVSAQRCSSAARYGGQADCAPLVFLGAVLRD